MSESVGRIVRTGAHVFVAAALLSLVPPSKAQVPGQPGIPTPPTNSAPTPGSAGNNPDQNSSIAPDQHSTLPMIFESHGIQYEALTRNGITVMFAPLPSHIKDYNVVQVTVTNGSPVSWMVKPSNFSYAREDGAVLPTISADEVVESLLEKAGRNDVIKLQLMYEDTIYGLANYRPNNGYERRREDSMAMFVNARFKAAAAASAMAMVQIKLKPGDSTDGAVFLENRSKERSLGVGRFTAQVCGESFVFQVYGSDGKTRP